MRPGSPVPVVIRTISERVQADAATMSRLRMAGVAPGARVTVETGSGVVTLIGPDGVRSDLSAGTAEAVHVQVL
ncbi:hypothetical protein GCM10011492_27020 [Flexivirga endophytica]|uniref:Diphteria toxin repressor/Iron-dependent repressor IdeR SH3 domain-containing protein n=1 Tax=Flexivirga endophytica TaxID=1849103 RepID=A0A916WV24_9MICO|nr:FeoA domain-containing protein [Flexivirga endophytica]GGB34958.1 hypothetical protein GCM10011492_27020 [Flexivirga endophytica]GHB42812.1 hypothetical protein GCM10008112_09400 [Flexivirga endophytica]